MNLPAFAKDKCAVHREIWSCCVLALLVLLLPGCSGKAITEKRFELAGSILDKHIRNRTSASWKQIETIVGPGASISLQQYSDEFSDTTTINFLLTATDLEARVWRENGAILAAVLETRSGLVVNHVRKVPD